MPAKSSNFGAYGTTEKAMTGAYSATYGNVPVAKKVPATTTQKFDPRKYDRAKKKVFGMV